VCASTKHNTEKQTSNAEHSTSNAQWQKQSGTMLILLLLFMLDETGMAKKTNHVPAKLIKMGIKRCGVNE
jgi:hypothetical protein